MRLLTAAVDVEVGGTVRVMLGGMAGRAASEDDQLGQITMMQRYSDAATDIATISVHKREAPVSAHLLLIKSVTKQHDMIGCIVSALHCAAPWLLTQLSRNHRSPPLAMS